jgi:hypothetical protein
MMEQELIDPSANDPASKAFDRLRREVTTMRLAVEHLADAPGKIEIPDYTATLTQIDVRITATHKALRTLADRPAIALTPEVLAQKIAAAGVEARRVEQAAFDKATSTFVTLGRELSSVTASARTARQQFKEKLWFGSGGILAGMMLATIILDVGSALAPTSWHWPEKRAVHVLDRDMWDAGERLQAVADPKRWEVRSMIEVATKSAESGMGLCLQAVATARKAIKCSIMARPVKAESER